MRNVSSKLFCILGCHIKMICLSVILYADDILLLAPSAMHFRKFCMSVRRSLIGYT